MYVGPGVCRMGQMVTCWWEPGSRAISRNFLQTVVTLMRSSLVGNSNRMRWRISSGRSKMCILLWGVEYTTLPDAAGSNLTPCLDPVGTACLGKGLPLFGQVIVEKELLTIWIGHLTIIRLQLLCSRGTPAGWFVYPGICLVILERKLWLFGLVCKTSFKYNFFAHVLVQALVLCVLEVVIDDDWLSVGKVVGNLKCLPNDISHLKIKHAIVL